jgi:hypothetical protein
MRPVERPVPKEEDWTDNATWRVVGGSCATHHAIGRFFLKSATPKNPKIRWKCCARKYSLHSFFVVIIDFFSYV